MRRREFITLVGGAVASPVVARAQPRGKKIPRIGIIDDGPIWEPFRQAFRDAGYVEGQTIAFEYRRGDGDAVQLSAAAADLVRLPVDVIATYGTPPSRAAKAATSTIPIVMILVGDPVQAGLVQSLAHPGGNVTGNTIISPDLGPKRLQLVKEIIPSAARVALLWIPTTSPTLSSSTRCAPRRRALASRLRRWRRAARTTSTARSPYWRASGLMPCC